MRQPLRQVSEVASQIIPVPWHWLSVAAAHAAHAAHADIAGHSAAVLRQPGTHSCDQPESWPMPQSLLLRQPPVHWPLRQTWLVGHRPFPSQPVTQFSDEQ